MFPAALEEPAAEVVGDVPVAVREVIKVVPAPEVVVVGLAEVVTGFDEIVVGAAVAEAAPETHWK
jgi:hypothetical protein